MELNQNLADFFPNNNKQGSGGETPKPSASPGGLSLDLANFFPSQQATPRQATSGTSLDPDRVNSIADAEGLSPTQRRVMTALLHQESGFGRNARTSVDGAQGPGQIIPATFRRYAKAGEDIGNADHNLAVMARIVKDLGTKFGDDPGRIATGYFSGEGNVNRGSGQAWRNDAADGNRKRVSSYVSDVLTRLSGISDAQATEKPAAPKAELPDLGKAKPWAEIAKNPEYQALDDATKAQAKAAYFDYWIAPHAGGNARQMRQQFLDMQDPTPGLMDRAGEMAGKVGEAIKSVLPGLDGTALEPTAEPTAEELEQASKPAFNYRKPGGRTPAARDPNAINMPGSVMDGTVPQDNTLPTTSKAPVRPEVRAAFNAQWDAATPEQRAAMAKQEGVMGQLARDRAGVFARQDELAKGMPTDNAMRDVDPRIEARRAELISRGEDPRFAETVSRMGAERGVLPGQEINAAGTVQKSDFDFDTNRFFKEQTGANNPLVRGTAKAVLGTGKAALGINQFLADVAGADQYAAFLKKGNDWLREKEGAIGEKGSFLERNLEGAINSIGQQLPWMVAGAATGGASIPLIAMGLQSFGQEYTDGRAQKQDVQQAATRASIFAAFEVLGEKFGLGEQLKALRGAARGMANDEIIKLLASALKKEVPGELLTTTGQFAADKWMPTGYALNPNATVEDFVKQVADTIAQTVMQSGLMGAGTTGVSTARRFMDERGYSPTIAAADAESARTAAMNKWQTQGFTQGRTEPTISAPAENLTEDGRIEPTLGAVPPNVEVAPAEPAPVDVNPMVQTADSIVSELASQAGVPLETVLPSSPQQTTAPESFSDQDVLDFAASRYQQLREKRDGRIESVPGENGVVDQDMPGVGLTESEQRELDALLQSRNNPAALRKLYGFDQASSTAIRSDASANQTFGQTPAPVPGQSEQPTAGQQFPATMEPGLVAAQSQENANVETQTSAQQDGLAQPAVISDGQPGGPAPVQEPAAQAPGPQVGAEGGQRYEGLPAEDAVTTPAPAQPRTEKEANQAKDYSEKWFASEEKAQAFIDKKKIGDTHEVVWNKKRYEIKRKSDNGTQAPEAKQAETQGRQPEQTPAAAAVDADEPPVPKGMTRLYHGSATHGRVDGKAWFSTNRQYAADYRKGAQLQYVDYPTEKVNAAIDPDGYGHTVDKGFTWNVELDSSETGLRKIIKPSQAPAAEPVAPKVGDILFDKDGTDYRIESERAGEVTLTKNRDKLSERTVRMSAQDFERLLQEDKEYRSGQTDELDAEMRSYERKAEAKVTPQVPNEPGVKYVVPSFATGQQTKPKTEKEAKAARQKVAGRRVYNEDGSYYNEPAASPKTEKEAKLAKKATDMRAKADRMEAAGGDAQVIKAMRSQADRDMPAVSANTVFTEDAAEKARALLKSKLNQLNSGVDPEVLQAGITLAGYHIEKGARTFSAYAKAMLADLGDAVKPYLKSWYMGVKYDPRAAGFDGMDSAATVEAANIDQVVENLATSEQKSSIEKPVDQAQNEPAPKEQDNGNTQRSDRGTGREPVAGAQEVRPTAASNERADVNLAGSVSDQVQTTGEGRQADGQAQKPQDGARAGERLSDRPSDDARQSDREVTDGRVASEAVTPTGQTVGGKPANFTITDELNFAGLGAKTKYANNVAAIRLLKQLEKEGRQATPAEQSVLARYIGWGGMPQAFDPKNDKWSKEFAELKELLTADEYATAASSTRNAHYTAAPVVEAIWAGVHRLGFKHGAVLEPSLGSGNFFGLMPVDARAKSSLFGVEFDHLTGGIAKQLYPEASVNAPVGFQDIKLSTESFDVAIGNPPFGSEQIYDKTNPEISKFKIHGFFFAKSVETLKPGGVLAMVVSKGLMDANDAQGKAARSWLSERTRLLGAIRLPNSAFQENANTEVTTDIIFLQKLAPGIEGNAADWNSMGEVADKETGQPIAINKYFVANPDMMLGEMTLAGSMYRANEPTLSARPGDNLTQLLNDAVSKLPKGVFKTGSTGFDTAAKSARKAADVGDSVREYGYYIQDGKLYQRMPDNNGERQSVPVDKTGRELERMVGMIELRETVRQQLQLEKNPDSSDKEIAANRAKLNKQYDAFVKKNGYLNSPTNKRLFTDDSDASLLLSLEAKYDKGVSEAVAKSTGQKPRQAKATKATIFERRVQTPVASVTKVGNAKEAMLASLNEMGQIDPEFMSRVYGKPFESIVAELGDLVYEAPGKGWMPADLYLSGNVKQALQDARAAAEKDARFERNVAALLAVQPADINPSDIFVKIGSPWVSVEDYNAFAQETFGGKVSGRFLPSTGGWSVSTTAGTPTENNTKYGTARMGAHRIIESLMTNKQVAVYDEFKDAEGNTKRVLNQEDTAAAQGKADELAEAFQEWIWKDNDRRERLSRAYNDTYNTNVPRKYDGSHLSLPGMNVAISLRPHQLNWVYRSLVEGVGLADHVVGAGKTFAMIASAMEMRRLGLANKPMIVVPNHLVGQWAKDIMALYPGANVLAASRKDFGKDRRKLLFSKIATGDWDMVVVAHSSFGRIPVPTETEQAILDDQLKEIVTAIEEAKKDKGARFTVKDLERAKTRIEEKLKKLADRAQDSMLDFADLGVDALFVDEAHEFKNLFFTTSLQGVAGLGSPQGSTRAFDMFVKTRYISQRTGGKNIFFATGTPLANSIAEVFHMQRYLQYDTLKSRGIHQFDAWANTFGQSTSDWEMNAAGKFVQKTRFRKFANLPELKGIWSEIADTVSRADLISDAEKQGKRFPLPKIKGGKPQNVVTERSDWQARFIGIPRQKLDGEGKPVVDENTGQPVMEFDSGTIVYRLENWKWLSKDNPKEIPLAITGQARKAGLDYRLIDDSAPDFEGSKINAAVAKIYDIWKANDYRKGTQLVFCDLSVPAKHKGQATDAAAEKVPTFFVVKGEQIEHVAGKALSLPSAPDVQFFSYKDGKRWIVSERTTGTSVASGNTKQEAIDEANARLARIDPAVMQKQIADKAIPEAKIDDYLARWEEQQASKDDTGSDEDSEEGAKEISLDEMLADGGGNFSVYDDIKAKLVAKGMPEDQIAFIHDYDTDEKKAALFSAVNAGEVRVLLGSTPKMGAGTNVQSKLVALHHMDAPWRPADLEQREGRIIRQGNEFYEADPDGFEIELYRYATKQTYDSRMWEIIETKARAIEQFKTDASLREIEDVSSESANAAEMKAGASGNPLILEEISLRTDLRKLESQKKAWDRSRFDLENKIKQADTKQGWVYTNRDFYAQAAKLAQPKNKDALGLVLDGKKIDDAKNLDPKAVFTTLMQAAAGNGGAGSVVAKYRGYDVMAAMNFGTLSLKTSYNGQVLSSTNYTQDDKFSVSGFITRLDNLVDAAGKSLDRAEEAIKAFEKDAANAKKELANGFPKAAALKSVQEQHKKVVAALRAGKTSLDGGEDATVLNNLRRSQKDQTTTNITRDLSRSPSYHFEGTDQAKRVNALAKLKALEEKRASGKITDAEYRLGVQQLIASMQDQKDERTYRQVVNGRRRGTDWIIAKLRRGLADGTVPRNEVEFAEWLLEQNPNLGNDLGVSVKAPNDEGASGQYNPAASVMTLMLAGEKAGDTTVHEIMHHAERMMPQSVQDAIVREWQRAWDAVYKKGDQKLKDALDDMLAASLGNRQAHQRVVNAMMTGTLNYADHYQLYSPSEFWAVNSTRILSGRYKANESWVKRAIQWFKEFVQRAKGFLGLRSDAPVIKALNAVMKGDGNFQHNARMLVQQDISQWLNEKEVEQGTTKDLTVQNITRKTQRDALNFWGNQKGSLKTFGIYDKTLSTQFNKALKDPHFGKVFGYVNAMQNEVSLTSIRPAELAPGVLPRIDNIGAAFKTLAKGKRSDKNLTQAANAVFAGTLAGNNVMEGRVWTEQELRSKFGLTDQGVEYYQQARNAIDASLDEVAAAEAYAMAQGFIAKGMRRQIIDNPAQASDIIGAELAKQMKMLRAAIRAAKKMGEPESRINDLEASLALYQATDRNIEKIFTQAKNLKAAGYAPLMRFGKYTVLVQAIDPATGQVLRDENGESVTEFYSQYETESEALAAKAMLEKEYRDADVRITAGTKSEMSHQMYAGISPETLALFAEAVGAESATKKYYQLALSERSALKRRLERKNIEGFNDDLPRVLSNFITSNGRFAAQRYYVRDLNNAIKFIPKAKGDVLDEAIKLKQFVMDPSDPAAPVSTVMFAWFLGGSVASAVVNLTQPVLMTAPYLSQFGVATATAAMTKALPIALGKKPVNDAELRDALKRASQEGIVDAQEIFHLYSIGAQGVASGAVSALSRVPGVGKVVKRGSEDLRARINGFLTIWGSMFAAAEGFNRRLTFVAAWEVAKANGEKNPYAFAVRAVNETQGIYNKVSRPNWARNAAGRIILTFKQFSLMYIELLSRLWKRGGPEGKRAALTMLAVLVLASGVEGLPFAQDLDDLIDTIGQMMGFDTNMRRSKRRLAYGILGKTMGDMFLYGVSSQLPLDFSGRLGLGNLIPGTGLLKPSNESGRTREVAEVFGPAAGMATQIAEAYDAAAEGNWGKAGQNLAPTAVKNAMAAAEMAKKGYATDYKGRKTVETDATDVAVKAIGFNPTKNAELTRRTMPQQQDIALQKKTESSIVEQWARGLADNDQALVDKAQKRLDDWNKSNKDTPIAITPNQIRLRQRQMLTDKDSRLFKQAPREMRGRLGLDALE